MNFNLNIHRVTNITVSPIKHSAGPDSVYATRTIEIKTSEGDFEISLFSEYVDIDHEKPLLEIKL
jgi:hypothetical protein